MASTPEGNLTTAQVLAALSKANPYPTYHDLEVAVRAYWRARSLFLPAHYTSRDFLTWAFDSGALKQARGGFRFSLDYISPSA